jgi:peptidoglycan/LPS O-acetylase OafA/YrhL
MRERLKALDGLRGLAAFSVAISHIGFVISKYTDIPLLIGAYRTLAVGPNSVQILFVLSGFLMAFLYPTITNMLSFFKKRVARIIPIYGVIVTAIMLNSNWFAKGPWYGKPIVFIGLAILVYLLWQQIGKYNWIGKSLFYGFMCLFFGMILFNIFVTPHLIENHQFVGSKIRADVIVYLSNLTLTTPFARDVIRLSTVFWSLAFELYFYLTYPFIVIPLVRIAKRFGWVSGMLVSILVIKVLFDLDELLRGLFSMYTLNIARGSGFVVGVLIGTMYQIKGPSWKVVSSIASKWYYSLIVLALFIAMQWGDWAVRDGQTIWFMNRYYLLSSIIFGLTVIAAVIPGTIVNRIFSAKVLVFLGMISYSLYLVHTQVIDWMYPMGMALIPHSIPESTAYLIRFFLYIFISVGISFILYKLVESLYFSSKKKQMPVGVETELPQLIKKLPRRRWSLMILFIILFVYVFFYTGRYTPTLFVSHHSYPTNVYKSNSLVSLLDTKSVKIPFTATENNLSIVTLSLWYYKNAYVTSEKDPDPAVLIFRLYEDGKTKPIYEASRSAFDIEGEPNFPFGIEMQSASKGKKYIAELSLKNGNTEDMIYVHTAPASIVTTYTMSKQDIMKNPLKPIFNRLSFTFLHPAFVYSGILFVLLYIGLDRKTFRLGETKKNE